jgi:hypothetical protein
MSSRAQPRSRSRPGQVLGRSKRALLVRADWWKWAFLPLGLLYIALLATHLGHMLVNVYGNADASSAPVLGEFYADRAGGKVILANLPWFSTLIFELATKWLPAHRQVWEIGPYLFALLSIALMAWAAWRVAGRWAATLTATILLCSGPVVLELMLWLNDHTTTWYSLALLAAFVVLMAERSSTLGWWPLATIALFVGVIVGINVASDKGLLVSGLLPLLFAGTATWIVSPNPGTRKTMILCVAAAAVAGVSTISTTAIMHSGGVFLAYYELKFATLEAISTNVKIWWQCIVLLGNGNFSGEAITVTTTLAFACAAASVGMVLLIPRYTWRYIDNRRSGEQPIDERLSVYMMFWAASLVCLSIGFIFSSVPVDLESTRYLVGLVYAVAAMLPLLARHGVVARAIVVAGTLVFLLTSIKALDHSETIQAPPVQGPSPRVAEAVARTAESMHATRGFAPYWDAAPITWRSNFRVQVAPFVGCGHQPTGLCPGALNYLEAWYRPGLFRTFLLTDSSGHPWTPPTALQREAVATYRFGTVTMYIYDHDIVTSLL